MTKEKLQERYAQLEKDKQQIFANLAATEGAMMDCKYWLDEIDKSVEKKEKVK